VIILFISEGESFIKSIIKNISHITYFFNYCIICCKGLDPRLVLVLWHVQFASVAMPTSIQRHYSPGKALLLLLFFFNLIFL